jgi:hypothetical protein
LFSVIKIMTISAEAEMVVLSGAEASLFLFNSGKQDI